MRITFLTAILPEATQRVCGLSHEFPLAQVTVAEEHELSEFVALAIELGAVGFVREDVDSERLVGMTTLSHVKRIAAAHPQAESAGLSRPTTAKAVH